MERKKKKVTWQTDICGSRLKAAAVGARVCLSVCVRGGKKGRVEGGRKHTPTTQYVWEFDRVPL